VGIKAFQEAIHYRMDGPIAPSHQEPGASLFPGQPGQSPDLIGPSGGGHFHLLHQWVGVEGGEGSRVFPDPAGFGIQDEERGGHDGLQDSDSDAVYAKPFTT
jgi:hypothetical protein